MKKPLLNIVLAIALASLMACSGQNSAGGGGGGGFGGKKKADRYLTEKVVVTDIEKTVLGSGALQPLEVVNVGAQASGQIQDLRVDLGSVVRRGQVIAVIDPANQQNTVRDAEARLLQAEAQRASNEAQLQRNELELERQASLVDRGFTSRASYDRAEADVKVSRAQIRSIEAQIRQAQIAVERAKVDLARTNIIAPIDGVVAAVVVREGQTVNAMQSAPTIVRLAKLDVMTVKAQISEADVLLVDPGQQAWFTVLGDPDRKFNAVLRAVDPAPENAGENLTGQPNAPVYYNALFDVPNTDGKLRPAMTAQVNVIIGRVNNVLAMPSAGLGEKQADGRYKVKVLTGRNQAEERLVRVGLNDSVHAQVLDGLKAGDEVIVADSWDASISGMPQPKAKQDEAKAKAKAKEKDKAKAKAKSKEKEKEGFSFSFKAG